VNELRRQAYLGALEVDYYHPRLLLPAAAVSTLCELPQPVAPIAVPVAAVVSAEATTTAATTIIETADSLRGTKNNPAMSALLDELRRSEGEGARAKSPEVVPVAAAAVIENSTAEQRPRFSLSIIRGADVFIVDQGLDESVDQPAYLALLHNILFALGAAPAQLSIDQFHWPMIKNSQVDQGETAAKQALQSFVGKQVEQLGLAYIVLMGEEPQRYLTASAPAGQFIADPQLGGQCIVTASALQALQAPALKQQIWQDLKPLNRVLRKA